MGIPPPPPWVLPTCYQVAHQNRPVVLEIGWEDGYKSCSISLCCLSLKAPSLGKKFPPGLTDLEGELVFRKRIGLTQISPGLFDKDMTGTTPREAFSELVALRKVSARSGGEWCPLGRGGCSISSAAAQQHGPGQHSLPAAGVQPGQHRESWAGFFTEGAISSQVFWEFAKIYW